MGNKKELPSLLKKSVIILTDKIDDISYFINYRLCISLINYMQNFIKHSVVTVSSISTRNYGFTILNFDVKCQILSLHP